MWGKERAGCHAFGAGLKRGKGAREDTKARRHEGTKGENEDGEARERLFWAACIGFAGFFYWFV
jgi:hypothetical protein